MDNLGNIKFLWVNIETQDITNKPEAYLSEQDNKCSSDTHHKIGEKPVHSGTF